MAGSPTIRAVEAVPVRIEGAREFRISEGATRVHVSVVLRLRADVDGLEGNAEVVSAPPGKPEEFLEEILGAIERYVAPALVGLPVRERGRAVQAVARALKGRGLAAHWCSPTIRAVEAVPVRIEGAREFRISEGATRVHVSVVLRLRTDVDGLEGNAEVVSAPPGKPEEFLEEIVGAIERYVAPALVGVPVRERGRAVQAVAKALKGRVWTKAAVTNALYDLHAKAIGVPVADLLGGRLLARVPVIGPVVGIMAPDAMAKEAAAQVGRRLCRHQDQGR